MPSRPPTLSRRRVLAGAAVLAALGVAGAGCGTPPPPADLDDLTTALDRSRSDSDLAAEVADSAKGKLAAVLTDIAAQRAAHAQALADEIVRLTGHQAPTATTEPSAAAPTSAPTPASVPPPTVDDVIGALRTSADSAAKSARVLSGYRAGLLASIAASCTAAYTVALAGAGRGR